MGIWVNHGPMGEATLSTMKGRGNEGGEESENKKNPVNQREFLQQSNPTALGRRKASIECSVG